MNRRRSLAGVAVLVAALLSCCDERFDFDVPGDTQQIPDAAANASMPDVCASDTDCPGSDLHCDVLTGSCFECVVEADCTDETRPWCDRALHRCVECAVEQNCDEDFTCDPVVRRCRRECDEDDECAPASHGCDTRRRVCIECDEDHECEDSGEGEYCAPGGAGCVECRNDDQCDAGQWCDALTGSCVECRDTRDCSSGSFCQPETHTCFED